jgi:exocyst complex component 2
LTVSNLTHLRETTIPRLINQFQSAYKVDMASDIQMLRDVTEQLDKILFDDYVKRKSAEIAKIIRKGVLGGAVNWYEADKPTGEFRAGFRLAFACAMELNRLSFRSCRGPPLHL